MELLAVCLVVAEGHKNKTKTKHRQVLASLPSGLAFGKATVASLRQLPLLPKAKQNCCAKKTKLLRYKTKAKGNLKKSTLFCHSKKLHNAAEGFGFAKQPTSAKADVGVATCCRRRLGYGFSSKQQQQVRLEIKTYTLTLGL